VQEVGAGIRCGKRDAVVLLKQQPTGQEREKVEGGGWVREVARKVFSREGQTIHAAKSAKIMGPGKINVSVSRNLGGTATFWRSEESSKNAGMLGVKNKKEGGIFLAACRQKSGRLDCQTKVKLFIEIKTSVNVSPLLGNGVGLRSANRSEAGYRGKRRKGSKKGAWEFEGRVKELATFYEDNNDSANGDLGWLLACVTDRGGGSGHSRMEGA